MEEKYKEIFLKYLINKIDFRKYDEEIDNSNLFFGTSRSFVSNINSKYFNLINTFYVDKLSESDINIISNYEDDETAFSVIERTYKEVLKKGDSDMIMYNPPVPEHNVKNGSIVFEFVYGKNIKKFSDEEFIQVLSSQRIFINNLVTRIENEIESFMGITCSIFVEKRI